MGKIVWSYWINLLTPGTGVSMSRQLMFIAVTSVCFCLVWRTVAGHEFNLAMSAAVSSLFVALGSIWGLSKINRKGGPNGPA